MIGLVLPWALVAACAAAGAWAYALVRQERAAYRGRVLSDRGLYEAGEAAATERKKPKLPRLARALHEAGVETPAANWAAGVAAIAFVSLSLAAALTGDPGIGAVVGAAALATAGVRLHVRSLAAAVRIQQRFGGAVAPVLDLIAAHAAARLRTSRELKTELAGTRLAKWFVALAMPAIFFIMFATNADFSQFYREQPLGWIVLGVAGCSEAFGLFACQRITAMDRSRR